MFGLGAGEILLVLFLAVIFLGPKKIPEVARMLGKAFREFQKAKDSFMDEIQNVSIEKKEDESENSSYTESDLRVEESKNSEIYNLDNANNSVEKKSEQQECLGG